MPLPEAGVKVELPVTGSLLAKVYRTEAIITLADIRGEPFHNYCDRLIATSARFVLFVNYL